MATQNEDASTSPVTIINQTFVYPKTLHQPTILSLSNLDRQCPLLMYLVFFYKKPSNGAALNLSLDTVFDGIKTGLEETLSVWYPAAGRLTMNPNDDCGKLNLSCNNGGAVLVKAETGVAISELGDLSEYKEFFESLVHKPVFDASNLSEVPLVVAQVTEFVCGGYSLGIGSSHSLFDGPAAYEFLNAWASQSSSNIIVKGSKSPPPPPSLDESKVPVHERGTLLMADKLCHSPNCNGNMIRVSAIGHLYQLIREMSPVDFQKSKSESYALKTFHLSGAMVQKLKQNLFGGDGASSSRVSSFEAVATHLWKARAKALGVTKDRTVCLQFAVDTRNKIDPPLPKNFSGNAYVLASVAFTMAELEESTHESIADKIRQAKNSVTGRYVGEYMKALEGSNGNLPPLKELTLVSDWRRLPFHKVDFLGNDTGYASPLVPLLPQVAYLMQNPSEAKGIDLRIGCNTPKFPRLARLENLGDAPARRVEPQRERVRISGSRLNIPNNKPQDIY